MWRRSSPRRWSRSRRTGTRTGLPGRWPGQTGMSQSAVSRIWRAFGLKPHIVQTWKLSTDPQFIDKVRDVVGLYMSPPENALVLCVDEKSQIQALDRTAPCLPMLPTTPARMTHDYVRNGTTSLFAAFDLASGSVIAQPYRQHRHQEFLKFLKLIDKAVPKDLGPAPGPGQLRHPQDPRDQGMAAASTPASTCTSPRPARPGSTSSSGGSLSSPIASSAGQLTAPSPSSKLISASGSPSGTRTPNRSSGPRPLTRSSKHSPLTVNELTTQDTRPPRLVKARLRLVPSAPG